jgi:predicted transcriptional regulator
VAREIMDLLKKGKRVLALVITVPVHLASKIALGKKQVEFRKKLPTRDVQYLFVCGAGTGGKVLAKARITGISILDPTAAWAKYEAVAGVTEAEFIGYVAKLNKVGCIEIADACPLEDKFLSDFGVSRPPQNFVYVTL